MAKDSTLSSDLSLIKELEELRIKQKLLVETLSKKDNDSHNEILAHINAKLDFLVKIFQEANAQENKKSEEKKEGEEKSDKHDKILEKLNSIEENFNARFEELSEKIEGSDSFSESKLPSEAEAEIESESIEQKEQSSENSELPPTPDFTSESQTTGTETETENKEESVDAQVTEKPAEEKKRKWF